MERVKESVKRQIDAKKKDGWYVLYIDTDGFFAKKCDTVEFFKFIDKNHIKIKSLKESVWKEFQAKCNNKQYTDLSNVGGTWCYRCLKENSMCRYSICPRWRELASNPDNFEEIKLK